MLTNTFCHIPGIGPTTERRLWQAGLRDWQAFDAAGEVPLSASRADTIRRRLAESAERLAADDPLYFTENLRSCEHWRLFREFRHLAAYLDIETTGLGAPGDTITSIALYDGRDVRTFVQGENLDDFADAIAQYPLIVTYNGKSFDVPFIRHVLRLAMPQAHIDLMHVLRALGIRGGLKGCERHFGMSRGELDGVDGFFAVLLWRAWRDEQDAKALETMLAYNVEDVVNLENLLVRAYNLNVQKTPFAGTHVIALPERPVAPHRADAATVERIRRLHYSAW